MKQVKVPSFNKVRRIVGGFLLGLALLLAIPPIVPTFFDDLINLFVAQWLSMNYGFEPLMALVLTYTILPFVVFCLGVFVSPGSNETVVNRFVLKMRKFVKASFKWMLKPRNTIITIVFYVLLYYFYTKIIPATLLF